MNIFTLGLKYILIFFLSFRTYKRLRQIEAEMAGNDGLSKMTRLAVLETLSLHALSPFLLNFCLPNLQVKPLSFFAPLPLLTIIILNIPMLNLTTVLVQNFVAPAVLNTFGRGGVVKLIDRASANVREFYLNKFGVEQARWNQLLPYYVLLGVVVMCDLFFPLLSTTTSTPAAPASPTRTKSSSNLSKVTFSGHKLRGTTTLSPLRVRSMSAENMPEGSTAKESRKRQMRRMICGDEKIRLRDHLFDVGVGTPQTLPSGIGKKRMSRLTRRHSTTK